MASPPRSVLRAFKASGVPVALAGGEGMAVRVGDFVLKPVHDVGEAEWTQAMLAEIDEDGFRVPTPLRTAVGGWVYDGWTASEFLPDLRPVAPRWADIVDCGLRFADAAERARPSRFDVLEARTHRWAVADRVAWQDADVELPPAATEVRQTITELLAPHPSPERHFVHGDLSGNVCAHSWLTDQRAWLANRIDEHVAPCDDAQVVHGDYHDANLLYRGHEISGVIDWDKAGTRSATEEVICCVHLSFGLDVATSTAFFDGYRSRRSLSNDQLDAAAARYGYERDRSIWLFDELYVQGNERVRPLVNERPFTPFKVSWSQLRTNM